MTRAGHDLVPVSGSADKRCACGLTQVVTTRVDNGVVVDYVRYTPDRLYSDCPVSREAER